MRFSTYSALRIVLLCGTVPASAAIAPFAMAQSVVVNQPAMPLNEALSRIAAQTGTVVDFDPDAVRGAVANPVRDAATAEIAVRRAIGDLPLNVSVNSGRISVSNDIVIRARRDEAERNLLVREATSSTRTGQTLREQPRNTQVISAKLIEEQQALTVSDALRNAGGVTLNTAAERSGVIYSVRGFASGGAINGLPASSGVAAGATQPIATFERIEVLKGPDAILLGRGNLGGTINIVTKKPSADPLLSVQAQTGSFGLRRFVLDANTALDDDKRFSARIIASGSDADRNFGGFVGNSDSLFSPGLRFKDSKTDILLTASLSEQRFGATTFAPINASTRQFFDIPLDRPLTRDRNQASYIDTSQFFGEVTHQVTPWLTLVGRAMHRKMQLEIAVFTSLGSANPSGVMSFERNRMRQDGNSDAVDGYARFDLKTGIFTHAVTLGAIYNRDTTDYFDTSAGSTTYNILTATTPPGVLPAKASRLNLQLDGRQTGYYGQYLLKFWRLSLLAGGRVNSFESIANRLLWNETSRNASDFTVSNYGAVLDVNDDIALFGTLGYGYIPINLTDRNLRKLPNTTSRNIEAGVKVDLFGDRALLNASWFQIRQSNVAVGDPTNFLHAIAIPGQEGTGIDVNLTGRLLPGLDIAATYTRTIHKLQTVSEFSQVVIGQPRDQYSVYTSYRRPVGHATVGAGAGLYGRSRSATNSLGTFYVPPARQVDVNAFAERGPLNINLSVRNAFDRLNYENSFSSTVVPVAEPRTWRLSVGYRFK